MLVFPQLTTGASGQYPITARRSDRTVVNRLMDGTEVRYTDDAWKPAAWDVRMSELSSGEWTAIEALFTAVEGRLQSFTFLDPTANLLTFSEDLGNGAWSNDPLLELTAGIADPSGTNRATRVINTGQAAQSIRQMVDVPGWFQYCFSLWIRASSSEQVRAGILTTGGMEWQSVNAGSGWQRIFVSANLQQAETSVSFCVELPPGASVDLFGLQVEAQLGAGEYKRTLQRNGVYPRARFAEDRLSVTTSGLDRHSGLIRISSQEA
jgi:hypothetical protein